MWTIGGKSSRTISKRIAFCKADKHLFGSKKKLLKTKSGSLNCSQKSKRSDRRGEFENGTSKSQRQRAHSSTRKHIQCAPNVRLSHEEFTVVQEQNGKVKSNKTSKSFSNIFATNTHKTNYAMVDREQVTSSKCADTGGKVLRSNNPQMTNVYNTTMDENSNTTTTEGTSGRITTTTKTNNLQFPSNTDPSMSNQSALQCDNNNALQQRTTTDDADTKTKTKKTRKDKGDGSSSKKSSKRRSKTGASSTTVDMCKFERPEAEGAEDIDFGEDPEAAEWAKLRCTSECTEVIAEREARRQKRCADYPGLAFGRSIFSSDTMMKFNIIRNELHNIMKSQLKRVIYNNKKNTETHTKNQILKRDVTEFFSRKYSHGSHSSNIFYY